MMRESARTLDRFELPSRSHALLVKLVPGVKYSNDAAAGWRKLGEDKLFVRVAASMDCLVGQVFGQLVPVDNALDRGRDSCG